MSKFNILSIDGGGMKGVISAIVIEELEKIIQELSKNKEASITDYFDMVAGTSTGAILAALYVMPDQFGRPKYTANDAIQMYLENGKKIFNRSSWHKIITMGGLCGPKYSNVSYQQLLEKFLEKETIASTVKPCILPAYHIDEASAYFFSTISAKRTPEKNFFLKDAVLASSAAPTYFPPAMITSLANKEFCMVDGGVCCNNPAQCAFTEALKYPNVDSIDDIYILSVGNVDHEYVYPCRKANKWGLIEWAIPMMHTFMGSSAQIADYEMQKLYDSFKNRDHYTRIVKMMQNPKEVPAMDNASEDALNYLMELGYQAVEENRNKIKEFAKIVIENSK